jgi:hypothetical protein
LSFQSAVPECRLLPAQLFNRYHEAGNAVRL